MSSASAEEEWVPKPTGKKSKVPVTVEEKVKAAVDCKAEGNRLFKKGNYVFAVKRYTKAFCYLNGLPQSDGLGAAYAAQLGQEVKALSSDQESIVKALQAQVHQNLGMAYVKMKKGRKAVGSCDKALALTPDNVKAMFWKAHGFLLLGDLQQVQGIVDEIQKLDPGSKPAKTLIKRVATEKKRTQQKERQRYKRLFGGKKKKADLAAASTAASGAGEAGGEGTGQEDTASTTAAPTATSSTSSEQ